MAASRNTGMRSAGLFAASAIALILLFHALLTPASPRNPSPAQWQTSTAGWVLPLPERAAALIGADDVRYMQQGHWGHRIEMTLREPDSRITAERGARLAIPPRPVVIDAKK